MISWEATFGVRCNGAYVSGLHGRDRIRQATFDDAPIGPGVNGICFLTVHILKHSA